MTPAQRKIALYAIVVFLSSALLLVLEIVAADLLVAHLVEQLAQADERRPGDLGIVGDLARFAPGTAVLVEGAEVDADIGLALEPAGEAYWA